MANEDKKDFNAMLHDNKDMPKFQIITDQKSIEKYGGSKMYFAPPIDYDKVMKKIPYGKVITVGKIREYFAELSGADFTEPITAGIFVSIVAWASYQRSEDETPYWRTLKANGELNAKSASSPQWETWSYVKKKYKLNVTNFLCSERSLTCYFYCILLDVFKILFLIFIWRQISTMTVNAYGIIKCFDVFKNQFMCMCIIKDFKPVDPFSLQKCMERFYTGVIPWICFL